MPETTLLLEKGNMMVREQDHGVAGGKRWDIRTPRSLSLSFPLWVSGENSKCLPSVSWSQGIPGQEGQVAECHWQAQGAFPLCRHPR